MYIYKTVQLSFQTAESMEQKINEIAKDGWELVCFGGGTVSIWRKKAE